MVKYLNRYITKGIKKPLPVAQGGVFHSLVTVEIHINNIGFYAQQTGRYQGPVCIWHNQNTNLVVEVV